ncbi:hypothetical protein SKAU_G00102940 [Synaphobranchus kaupii]|uniref:C2 domain-containing protein n=1 Tax=Synaphobranchus kaupii TaxID=118154 RepID=A0A9Q1FZW4_SYNKA|nr:hypothetical protein SKAU_G00102940 [Synaphobranchus kaupii]
MYTSQTAVFGRTEVIDNTLNPDFVRKYILDYFFEEKQNLRFDLYDVDSKSPDLSKHDFLGQVFCTLGEIVGSPGSRLEKPLGADRDPESLTPPMAATQALKWMDLTALHNQRQSKLTHQISGCGS